MNYYNAYRLVGKILDGYEVPKVFQILNLDIDSYDLSVMYSIFQAEYRPIIISIEINEKIPLGIIFYVNYDIDVQWNGDHFYGCSLDAAVQLFKRRDYVLVALEYNNAFFIPKNKVTAHLLELDIEDAYNRGYKNKPDREKLFGYNNEFNF